MSTMLQYTEEALDKTMKRELIPIVLSFQNKITENNNVIFQEMRKFNDNFVKLEAELVINKRVSSKLCKKIVSMDCQWWAISQYSRRERL